MTNLDNKTPIYCQLYQDYNSAAIIETNPKVGPLYLVDCCYDKESDKYTIDYDSKQLLNDYILASDVLFFLNKVESNVSKKGILILHKNKYYLYPLSTQNIDSLIPSKLYKL